ncbi:MAG: (Fe-S)-binding protein [Acidobacteriota bacterium]
MTENLDFYKDEVFRCMRCGLCLPSCPVYSEEKIESMGPRGRLSLIESYVSRKFKLSKIYKDRIKKCLECKSCFFECPSGIKIDEIIHLSKEDIFYNEGFRIFPNILKSIIKKRSTLSLSFEMLKILNIPNRVFHNKIDPNRFFYNFLILNPLEPKKGFPTKDKRSSSKENKKIFKAKKSQGKVIFYRGCLINYIYKDIEKASIDVLNRLGFDVVLVKDEICCGAPLYSYGDRKGFKEIAEINIKLFKLYDEAPVISSCPTCTVTLKNYYKELFPDNKLSPSVWDINEFIMKYPDIDFRGFSEEKRITYHDPCHLKRSLGIHKEPRLFLKSIPNANFIEMKDSDRCCGFAGLFSFFYHDLARKIALKKLDNIKDSKADTVITSCPGCMMHIQRTLIRENSPIEVKHIVEILREANIYV